MRSGTLFRAAFACALLVCTSLLFFGCSRPTPWRSLKTGDYELRWKPAAPQIGDLVEFEARISAAGTTGSVAGSEASETGESVLCGPDGNSLAPLASDIQPDGSTIRWSFRITQAGDWTWKTAGQTQVLWSTATIAGNSDELKKLDAQYLWSGKKQGNQARGNGATAQPAASAPAAAAPGTVSP